MPLRFTIRDLLWLVEKHLRCPARGRHGKLNFSPLGNRLDWSNHIRMEETNPSPPRGKLVTADNRSFGFMLTKGFNMLKCRWLAPAVQSGRCLRLPLRLPCRPKPLRMRLLNNLVGQNITRRQKVPGQIVPLHVRRTAESLRLDAPMVQFPCIVLNL